jgi:hypothetical protein
VSQAADALYRALRDITILLEPVEVGPPDRRRWVKRVDLAVHNARANIAESLSSGDGERGGTTSVTEAEDRAEEQRVHNQAIQDLPLLERKPEELAHLASSLFAAGRRQTETLHPSKLPGDGAIPQCASCKRDRWDKTAQSKIGGHFAPLREDVKRHGLCDWCYRHALASANERGRSITRDDWPPVEACHKRHTVSARAAHRWLAEHQRVGVAT